MHGKWSLLRVSDIIIDVEFRARVREYSARYKMPVRSDWGRDSFRQKMHHTDPTPGFPAQLP